MERFSNKMPQVTAFKSLREPISDAYFPKMESLVTSRAWPSRPANTHLADLNRTLDQIKANVSDIELWSDRFVEACRNGYAIDVSITEQCWKSPDYRVFSIYLFFI